ncbi:MAG: SH3 domain-containing protein [Pseudomonadota bacterium]|nr:SH3 domain-containing protein [Pseudomonadota bacterium]
MERAHRCRAVLSLAAMLLLIGIGFAGATPRSMGPSGLPLPRYASLKAKRVNVRVGPGTAYPVEWTYVKSRLPVEIYQEYGNWRRIRDWDGNDGWVFGPLLSGRRTALVAPWSKGQNVPLRTGRAGGSIRALLEPRVLVDLLGCDGSWCRVAVGRLSGFLKQTRLWGVYPGEAVD